MTLIETIVAFAIISVIIVVAMLSINTIANVNVKAQDINTADEALEEKIALGTGFDIESVENLTLSITDSNGAPINVTVEGRILKYDQNDRLLRIFQLNR